MRPSAWALPYIQIVLCVKMRYFLSIPGSKQKKKKGISMRQSRFGNRPSVHDNRQGLPPPGRVTVEVPSCMGLHKVETHDVCE